MGKRIILFLAAFCLLTLPLAGCKKAKATPSAKVVLATARPQATATFTPEPATATPLPPTAVPTTVPKEPEGPPAPELLDPLDEATGTLFDLTWSWAQELAQDAVFVLWIWPDSEDAPPQVYELYRESPVRITSANLPPGRYRWQVVVARQADGKFTDHLSPFSEVRVFVLVYPSLKANISATPPEKPTATASATPTATRTNTPVRQITIIVVTPTYTFTPVPPTATFTPEPPTATPTETSVYPGPTATTEPYVPPEPTPTPTTEPYAPPEPTATATTEPYGPPVPTATATTEPYAPPEPTAEPTATTAPEPTPTTGGGYPYP